MTSMLAVIEAFVSKKMACMVCTCTNRNMQQSAGGADPANTGFNALVKQRFL